jgi:succinoglycan biosynthesis transport protein ExoP
VELKDYLAVLRRQWWLVAVIAAIAAVCAGAGSVLATPMYQAHAQLFVSVRGGDSVTDLAQGNSFSERRVSSYVSLATSSRVLGAVIEELDLPYSVEHLKTAILASTPAQTVLIDIDVRDPDAELARQIANATSKHLIAEVGTVEGSDAKGGSLVTMSVAESATTPSVPVSPSIRRNVFLGFVGGALLGMVIAVLRRILDTRIRDRAGLGEVTELPVLGQIPVDPEHGKRPLAILREPHAARAERFRQLRTQLQFTNLDASSQSIVVTSSVPGEGKSSTSTDLALMLAEGGGRVLLIDADLRRPRLADILGLEGAVGLTTVLSGRIDVADAVQRVGGTNPLDVLTSGRIPPNPSELLGSPAMVGLLRGLEQEYDAIILDAPPAIPVTDPAVLATLASGVLVVVGMEGRLRREQLSEGLAKLESVGARMLGLVLNRVVTRAGTYETYEYRAAEPTRRDLRRARRRPAPVRRSLQGNR